MEDMVTTEPLLPEDVHFLGHINAAMSIAVTKALQFDRQRMMAEIEKLQLSHGCLVREDVEGVVMNVMPEGDTK